MKPVSFWSGAELILDIFEHPSPNHGDRRGQKVQAIILHYTGMPSTEGALDWLCNEASQVSSHYFVFEDGRIARLVPEDRRAWHAGRGTWANSDDLNSISVGIEIANPGHPGGSPAYPQAQIEAVIALCRDIAARHTITPSMVLAHSDIAPGRKIDPGEFFPWEALKRAGLGAWVAPAPIVPGLIIAQGARGEAVSSLQQDLRAWGYGIAISGDYDQATRIVVEAFQRHFRPAHVDGVADVSTRETLRALLDTYSAAAST